jgi:hypothetical protein
MVHWHDTGPVEGSFPHPPTLTMVTIRPKFCLSRMADELAAGSRSRLLYTEYRILSYSGHQCRQPRHGTKKEITNTTDFQVRCPLLSQIFDVAMPVGHVSHIIICTRTDIDISLANEVVATRRCSICSSLIVIAVLKRLW